MSLYKSLLDSWDSCVSLSGIIFLFLRPHLLLSFLLPSLCVHICLSLSFPLGLLSGVLWVFIYCVQCLPCSPALLPPAFLFLLLFFVCVKHTRFLIEYQPFFHAFTLSSRLAVHSVSASSSLFSFSL